MIATEYSLLLIHEMSQIQKVYLFKKKIVCLFVTEIRKARDIVMSNDR